MAKITKVELFDSRTGKVIRRLYLSPRQYSKFLKDFKAGRYRDWVDYRIAQESDEEKLISGLPKICHYAGQVLNLIKIYDERKNPQWDREAQAYIDAHKGKACCLHKGYYHGLYGVASESEKKLNEELKTVIEQLFFFSDEAERLSRSLSAIGKYKEATRYSDIAEASRRYAHFLKASYGLD